MRTAAITIISALAVSMTAASAHAEINWQENLRTAHTQAQAEGKLLLLHFYSDNCTWCERLEKGSFQNPVVGNTVHESFVPVKIHANSSPKLTQTFKVTKFPTDIIITTEGRTLSHSVSPQDPNKYIAMLTNTVPSLPAKSESQAQVAKAEVKQDAPSYAVTKAPQAQVAAPTPQAQVAASQPDASAGTASFTMPGSNKVDAKLTGANLNANGLTLQMPEQIDAAAESVAAVNDAAAAVADLESPGTESFQVPALDATSNDSKPAPSDKDPELAMQGFCPVTVINEDRWVEGNPKFGVVHLGKLYLFSNQEKMDSFLADPVPYTPVLNEIDVVRFFEERKIVPGKREWGLKDPVHNRMFFFYDEAAMNHFYNKYEIYTDAAIEVMSRAVKEANPGT
ncbi:MAG: DUF255 domain-containing protein [Rubripirellula sp.]